jgi:hypothetical protein
MHLKKYTGPTYGFYTHTRIPHDYIPSVQDSERWVSGFPTFLVRGIGRRAVRVVNTVPLLGKIRARGLSSRVARAASAHGWKTVIIFQLEDGMAIANMDMFNIFSHDAAYLRHLFRTGSTETVNWRAE